MVLRRPAAGRAAVRGLPRVSTTRRTGEQLRVGRDHPTVELQAADISIQYICGTAPRTPSCGSSPRSSPPRRSPTRTSPSGKRRPLRRGEALAPGTRSSHSRAIANPASRALPRPPPLPRHGERNAAHDLTVRGDSANAGPRCGPYARQGLLDQPGDATQPGRAGASRKRVPGWSALSLLKDARRRDRIAVRYCRCPWGERGSQGLLGWRWFLPASCARPHSEGLRGSRTRTTGCLLKGSRSAFPRTGLASPGPHGPVPRFKGHAPGSVATLVIQSFKESSSLSTMAPALKKALLGQYARDDPHATVTQRNVVVDGTPAVQFLAHYRGIWRSGYGQMTDVIDFFFHRGMLYDFDYRSVAPWTPKYLRDFTGSAKSIRLT